MRLIWRFFGVCLLAAASVAAPHPSFACTVCVELPEYSLTDRILSARVIVLAAPSPDDPFKYAPVALLKGTPEQLASLPDIPFLIDSVTRSVFRSDPEKDVLMIYGGGYRDKAGRSLSNAWSKGFLMTPERTAFFAAVQAESGNWVYGQTDNPGRVEFFGRYLNHDDRLLRDTALLEIHRAPYPIARQLRDVVPTQHLIQELRNVQRLAYAPAIIRLLGLRSDPKTRAFVRNRYRDVLRTGGPNLADWVLAGIEVDGPAAISAISDALVRSDWSEREKQMLVQALADGGSAFPEYQTQISEIYKRELDQSAFLAGWIALAAKDWGSDALNDVLREVVAREELDPATLFLIQNALGSDAPG